MNRKTIERLGMSAVITAFVAYFCYQVAYGITIGSNGTYTIHGANGTWATFTAPPGTVLKNMTINAEPNGYGVDANNITTAKPFDLGNSTWIMLNGTHSISKVKFTETCQTSYDVCMGSFVRVLHGNTSFGSADPSVTLEDYFHLCPNLQGCEAMKTIEVYSDHLVFLDSHHDTIRLMRIGMPQIAKAETDCSRTDLTQDERYTCGYNHGYLDAQTDWNLHRFPPEVAGIILVRT